MFIKSVHIKKFRGFNDVSFILGTNLTVIAGQNGTQKTTLLGILSQPFTITDKENPLYGERPLCGGNYKSLFSEKFKLSDAFDTPQSHEWTLHINDDEDPEFTVESIKRDSGIRFWKKGDRSKGSGYIQLPVIYLSLSRLFPIGEDTGIGTSKEIVLTNDEFNFYKDWHNKILIIPDVEMTTVDYLVSKQKNTLGVNTEFYDWKMNSAGQDNIGKILLAILSFKRLKTAHGAAYRGGILVIDELDATLYPASQIKLIEALRKFSSQLNLQVIFTTHSLSILERACELHQDQHQKDQVKVVYLQKIDSKVKALENVSFDVIRNKLNVALAIQPPTRKIPVFTEDSEGEIFFRAIIKRRSSGLEFLNCTLGCDNLIELSRKRIKGFKFPESLIVLDGDVKSESSKMRRINQLDNIIILPGQKSPERILAEFLHGLSDESPIWDKIQHGYSKQHVFQDFTLKEIQTNRDKAKAWFNSQKQYWGRNCTNVINPWIENNIQEVEEFISEYEILLTKYKNY
ncbi:ATP-dependent nuclease [Chitinophaga japonensis]|uniref:AAA15 family ATPase/GTPase n=1 Tax=Chitinophaga japonensis TaxID=104662 RepID=A0A562T6X6_CHIJA|nr:AAA family ATPase [Chitinophaga japonensis]TWI89285.1 AAA15 family ATPase/GTPase [Chitinophaga japonensis]